MKNLGRWIVFVGFVLMYVLTVGAVEKGTHIWKKVAIMKKDKELGVFVFVCACLFFWMFADMLWAVYLGNADSFLRTSVIVTLCVTVAGVFYMVMSKAAELNKKIFVSREEKNEYKDAR